MRRTRKSYLLMLVTAVVALLLSTWGTGVSLAQEHDMDHDDGGDHDHEEPPPEEPPPSEPPPSEPPPDDGGGDPGDGPPYGPPPEGRNPGEQRTTVTQGPFNIPAPSGGEHHGHTGNRFAVGEKPCDNCQITSMTAKLVNAAGEEIGNQEGLQLHHMVLLQRQAGRDDATCGGLSFPVPFGLLFGERFFASGDERTAVTMPPGYGYPVGTGGWTLIYELANGNDTPQDAYIEMTYDYVPGNTLSNVDPVWFDIDQCGVSATNVPAGQHTRTYTWNVNRPGDVLVAGGHQHGNWLDGAVDGGTNMELRVGGETGEVVCDSVAGYDESPFYTDNHGMKWLSSMSKCGNEEQAEALASVNVGDQMTITSHYDQQTDWPGQMGIMIAYVAPDGAGGGAPPPTGGGDDPPPAGEEPPAEEDCSFLGEIFGLCGDDAAAGEEPPAEEEDCGLIAGLLGWC